MSNVFLDAHRRCAYPVVIELVGSAQWSIRHADAALRALLACELTPAQQDTVLTDRVHLVSCSLRPAAPFIGHTMS